MKKTIAQLAVFLVMIAIFFGLGYYGAKQWLVEMDSQCKAYADGVAEAIAEKQPTFYEWESEGTSEYGTYGYYVNLIKQEAIERGIDYKICVAVSRLETGNFKSSHCTKGFNFGGIGSKGVKKYASEEEGLNAFMKLCESYYKKYGTDVEAWSKRYCPANAEAWAKAVSNIMKEVK